MKTESYLPPFALLKERVNFKGGRGGPTAQITYAELTDLVKLLIQAVPVDEAWYENEYPDVAEAIKTGAIKSATTHFIESGYFEGRWPFPPRFDQSWYLTQYPDVAKAIEVGEVASAEEHFRNYGYLEGRLPCNVVDR